MRVERLRAVVVRDDDIIAVAAVPCAVIACDDNRAVRGGVYRRAARGAEVHRVPAVEALREDSARHRIAVVARLFRTATAQIWFARSARRARARRGNGEFSARNDDG